jgi:hypothetical protein
MASLTSKSDSSRRGDAASFVILFFFSLTTDTILNSQNPQVPVAHLITQHTIGVRVHFIIISGCPLIFFRLQTMATLTEGNQWQMWEFIRI